MAHSADARLAGRLNPRAGDADTRSYTARADRVPTLVISDHRLPRFDSIRTFNLLRRTRQQIPLVIMSGTLPEETVEITETVLMEDTGFPPSRERRRGEWRRHALSKLQVGRRSR